MCYPSSETNKVYIVWGEGGDYIVVDSCWREEKKAEERAVELNVEKIRYPLSFEDSALCLEWSVQEMIIRGNTHNLIDPGDDKAPNSWFVNP